MTEPTVERLLEYIGAMRRSHHPSCPLAADDPSFMLFMTNPPTLPACRCDELRRNIAWSAAFEPGPAKRRAVSTFMFRAETSLQGPVRVEFIVP